MSVGTVPISAPGGRRSSCDLISAQEGRESVYFEYCRVKGLQEYGIGG